MDSALRSEGGDGERGAGKQVYGPGMHAEHVAEHVAAAAGVGGWSLSHGAQHPSHPITAYACGASEPSAKAIPERLPVSRQPQLQP